MSRKIDYDRLLRKASLSVVRDILKHIATEGLFRKQHLYITFAIKHQNVKVSDTLREDFDEEMTIVLQYEFWDLVVDDFGFSVGLTFDHAEETIYVPFASIISVNDPSEDFSLEFVPDFSDLLPTTPKTPQQTQASKIISLDMFRK